MITALMLGLFALLMLAVLLHAVRGESGSVHNLQELERSARPVDLEAFRNLTDPREEQYLREELAPAEFRAVQRERLRAALGYVRRAAHNASLLLRVGEAARRSLDPEIVKAGDELAASALRLRVYALLAVGLLRLRILLPQARWNFGQVAADYQGLRDRVARLCRLQLPAHAGRISAVL